MRGMTHRLAVMLAVSLAAAACRQDPETIAIQDPVYPAAGESVAYTVERISGGAVASLRLFERVATIDATGAVTAPGTEVELANWASPADLVTHTKAGGASANSLVSYRVEVEGVNGKRYSHVITYAVRPYPVPNQPAPVFAVGDVDDVFDVVMIPDFDVTDIATFRDHARRMIREAFLDEETTRLFRRSFNFYINPDRGRATDYDRIATDGLHQTPANWANLSFAEGKVLMHQNNLRDYASGGLFSTELQNRGTMLHESGHSLFALADEYSGGAHWQAATLPNNWSSQAGAQADASSRGKTVADVVQIGTTAWWKMCASTCQMNVSGLAHSLYDRPDKDRVIFAVIDNAIH